MAPLTEDELTVMVEALREYRLRMPDPARRQLSEALIYRFGLELIDLVERSARA